MLSEPALILDEIFVGREQELRILNLLWKKTLKTGERHVYVLLNAPGTGKTRLLLHFGEQLEQQRRGLFFHYRCSSRFTTTTELNVDLIKRLRDLLSAKSSLIQEYILSQNDDLLAEEKLEELKDVKNRMTRSIRKDQANLVDVVALIQDLVALIPLFFVADEIQEFQKKRLRVMKNDSVSSGVQNLIEETALHYFTRILKDLMHVPVLMILSGTQYHILSQIGTKIGSPIAQKVEQLVIKNFTPGEIDSYVDQVNDRILKRLKVSSSSMQVSDLVVHYRWFLHAFSGGHPRTIVFITQQLLADVSSFLQKSHDREIFVNALFPLVETDFKNRIFTSEKRDQIRALQAHESFPIVKEWLLTMATTGLLLGPEPVMSEGMKQHQVTDLVYQLMTLGVIVKNGLDQYHVTSYFHLLAFLECFTGEYEMFLHQVLTNRFFKLLCGGHTGFGYTFEHVLLSSLLLKGYQVAERHEVSSTNDAHQHVRKRETVFLLSLNNITTVKELTGDVDWSRVILVPGTLYHVPQARAIDMFVLTPDSHRLVLIQVTTTVNSKVQARKMESLARMVNEVKMILRDKDVVGWFISLFPISNRDLDIESDDVIITAGPSLRTILGQDLLERLMNVEKELSSRG